MFDHLGLSLATNATMASIISPQNRLRVIGYLFARELIGRIATDQLNKLQVIPRLLNHYKAPLINIVAKTIKRHSWLPLSVLKLRVKNQFPKAVTNVTPVALAVIQFLLVYTPNKLLTKCTGTDDVDKFDEAVTPRWEVSLENVKRIACFTLLVATPHILDSIQNIWCRSTASKL